MNDEKQNGYEEQHLACIYDTASDINKYVQNFVKKNPKIEISLPLNVAAQVLVRVHK